MPVKKWKKLKFMWLRQACLEGCDDLLDSTLEEYMLWMANIVYKKKECY